MDFDFKKKLAEVRAFLTPESLKEKKIAYEAQPGDLALLIIDVQHEFCDPTQGRGNTETKQVSKRIKDLIPEFRKAGVPAYVIYFSYREKKPDQIDFYLFTPDKQDVLIAKNADSAFQGSDIKTILKDHQRTKLLACGFNLNACVFSTVMDARKNGFDVCVMRDLTGNDNCNDSSSTKEKIAKMEKEGIKFSDSATVLQALGAKTAKPAKKAM
jgi:nicotinamidase-related amidase